MKREMVHPAPVWTGGAKSIGPLSDLVSVQLRRVDLLLTRGFSSATKGMNLRSGMISCLGLIVANPGISQKEITQQTGTDKSVIASLVDSLEERGWATRTRSTIDHRRYALYATPEGEARLEQFAEHIRQVENELLADIDAEELTKLSALLDRMHHSCVAVVERMANT